MILVYLGGISEAEGLSSSNRQEWTLSVYAFL